MSDQLDEKVLGMDLNQDDKSGADAKDDKFDADAFLAENVGEGKQYATEREALIAVANRKFDSDVFIKTLQLEVQGERQGKEELEAKLLDAKKIDDLLSAINADVSDPPKDDDDPSKTDSAQVDMDQVKTIVKDMFDAEKVNADTAVRVEAIKANQDKAFDLMSKPVSEGGFGSLENAKLAIREFVGTDKERADIVNRMGSHTPEAVAEFLKIQLKGNDKLDGAGGSEFTVEDKVDMNINMLTWAKAKDVKKKDPKLYKSRQFQMQIHAAAAANPNFWK